MALCSGPHTVDLRLILDPCPPSPMKRKGWSPAARTVSHSVFNWGCIKQQTWKTASLDSQNKSQRHPHGYMVCSSLLHTFLCCSLVFRLPSVLSNSLSLFLIHLFHAFIASSTSHTFPVILPLTVFPTAAPAFLPAFHSALQKPCTSCNSSWTESWLLFMLYNSLCEKTLHCRMTSTPCTQDYKTATQTIRHRHGCCHQLVPNTAITYRHGGHDTGLSVHQPHVLAHGLDANK